MCLPPIEKDPEIFFKKMQEISGNLKLEDISMGMSNDYKTALKYKASFIRIGSKIFGERS